MDGPRDTHPDEVPAVLGLVNAVFRGAEGGMGRQYPTLFALINAAWLRTVWDGPRPVAHVGVWRGDVERFGRRLRVAHLGAVCTHPDYRQRGLAGRILADALQRLHGDGTAVVFISRGRGLYQRLGARAFGDLRRAALTPPGLAAAGVEASGLSWSARSAAGGSGAAGRVPLGSINERRLPVRGASGCRARSGCTPAAGKAP